PATGRVLSECTITGQNTQGTGPPLIATCATGRGAPGAPVLNEFGELIGLVGDLGRTGEVETAYSLFGPTLGTPIVPITVINVGATATPMALADLGSGGITVPAGGGEENVLTGGFGRVDAKGKLVSPEHHEELSVREKAFAVFVMWSPKERVRGQIIVRLFDADNRPVAESKP